MDCNSIISAIIGGCLTLLGVYITLKEQDKKDAETRKLSVKPWIFSYEHVHLTSEHTECIMVPDSDFSNAKITGKIKNTDNGILILDYVESENAIYKPNNSSFVVEKNSVIELIIFLKDKVETLKSMSLYVKDIYGNQYRYELILNGTRFMLGKCEEV